MWYSSTKVGIMEIDMDHTNVDAMLKLYFSGQAPEHYLENIIDGLIRHFIHEEKIIDRLGLEFPEEHKTKHVRLTGLLEKRIADWKSGRLDGKDIADSRCRI